ncbi:MAG: hypothetical protein RIB65_11905 [Ilumatobacter fluminis]|uniref:SHOCT domain-containing protein n=1 Tax=Ilumatobacter fluminis TaxID=467091 RepID=A0A4V3EIU0_9ACTN|nr:hypothetical protein [Ilumatobacter fluminis]TDT15718.1 hypothetical protein BDK89_1295 [Ilumatobacter fluminis]
MSQASFQKRMREKKRQEKKEAKRERKEERAAEAEAAAAEPDEPVAPQDEVLAQLAALHKRFDDEQIDFDEFEERKQELMAKLAV